ncbi:related to glutathione transferase omega 1 [Cephalotrichum gorgonifer]|uniref:Related to glutathione transferase omega 1 n=1 Tax=Cephalotrichum gorgonifer TaxID=2041049 RepID=A0AAE8N5X3_9PEZI|nr:related to glutathione transferase omega 1 [Cephalotrichum gorgonifer]
MSTVDTSIQPSPTGAAAAYAAAHAHADPGALTLYGGWFCPFVQRVWITLHEKSAPHRYVEINPYKKDRELLDLNPRGLVPTLRIPAGEEGGGSGGARALYESLVVCEYLEEAFPGGGEEEEGRGGPIALLPRDTYERARCRLWIDHVATRIVPAFYKLLQHTPEKPYTLDSARADLVSHIRTLALEMDPGGRGPWFLGDAFSLVDVALAPWAKRLFLIDHYKDGGAGIPDPEGLEGEDARVWRRWRTWFDAVGERPSVRDTWSDEEEYVKVYRRYADDTTQSLVGKATREGGRLP